MGRRQFRKIIGNGSRDCCVADLIVIKGRITSFSGHQIEKYTSLKAHPEAEGPVHQFLFNDRGVISLAAKSVHLTARRGLTQWHIEFVTRSPFSVTSVLR